MADQPLTATGLDGLARYMQALARGGIRQSANQVATSLGHIAQNKVRAYYLYLARGQKRSAGGSLSYLKGKDIGAHNPARLPRSGDSGFTQLYEATLLTRIKTGHLRVHIDPKKTHKDAKGNYPGGVPLPLLAYWIESQKPSMWPVTLRMATYFRLLNRGVGGYGTKGGDEGTIPDSANRFMGRYIVVIPPDRPVWRRAIEDIGKAGAKVTEPAREYLAKMGKQYGMRPL